VTRLARRSASAPAAAAKNPLTAVKKGFESRRGRSGFARLSHDRNIAWDSGQKNGRYAPGASLRLPSEPQRERSRSREAMIAWTADPRHYRCADKRVGQSSARPVGRTLCSGTATVGSPVDNASTLQQAKRVQEICGGPTREAHVHRPQHCKPMVCLSPDHASGEFRGLAGFGARVSIGQRVRGNPNLGRGRQGKSAAFGRAHVVGWIDLFCHRVPPSAGASDGNVKIFNRRGAIAVAPLRETDPSPTSSIRRKQRSRGCADGRPVGPLIEVLGTRLAPCRTDAIDPERSSCPGDPLQRKRTPASAGQWVQAAEDDDCRYAARPVTTSKVSAIASVAVTPR
jgi:hypothetical protein